MCAPCGRAALCYLEKLRVRFFFDGGGMQIIHGGERPCAVVVSVWRTHLRERILPSCNHRKRKAYNQSSAILFWRNMAVCRLLMACPKSVAPASREKHKLGRRFDSWGMCVSVASIFDVAIFFPSWLSRRAREHERAKF